MLFAETIPISYCRREKGIEVRAFIVEILFAFLRLYRDVSLTVGGLREDR